MAIKKDMGDAPRGRPHKADAWYPDEPVIMPPVIDEWWKRWQEREGFHRPMSIEDREFRGSWAGLRCDRALWYAVNGEPESNPSGAAGHWRMATGSVVHLLLDEHVTIGPWDEVIPEIAIDLRPIGINGASSGDLAAVNHAERKVVVVELKTKGGFKFKLCTMDWKGGPLGPEYGDVVQGVFAAAGVEHMYPGYEVELRIVYLALELISEGIADKNDISEYGKFMAEWVIPDVGRRQILDYERKRVNSILAEPLVPIKVIDDIDAKMPVRRMEVTDIDKGAMVGEMDGGQVYGSTWRCLYCRWRDTCRSDG